MYRAYLIITIVVLTLGSNQPYKSNKNLANERIPYFTDLSPDDPHDSFPPQNLQQGPSKQEKQESSSSDDKPPILHMVSTNEEDAFISNTEKKPSRFRSMTNWFQGLCGRRQQTYSVSDQMKKSEEKLIEQKNPSEVVADAEVHDEKQ